MIMNKRHGTHTHLQWLQFPFWVIRGYNAKVGRGLVKVDKEKAAAAAAYEKRRDGGRKHRQDNGRQPVVSNVEFHRARTQTFRACILLFSWMEAVRKA